MNEWISYQPDVEHYRKVVAWCRRKLLVVRLRLAAVRLAQALRIPVSGDRVMELLDMRSELEYSIEEHSTTERHVFGIKPLD